MNYTDIYRKVYAEVKSEKISHEEAHRISLSITDAISNLSLIIKEYPKNVGEVVKSLLKDTAREYNS